MLCDIILLEINDKKKYSETIFFRIHPKLIGSSFRQIDKKKGFEEEKKTKLIANRSDKIVTIDNYLNPKSDTFCNGMYWRDVKVNQKDK